MNKLRVVALSMTLGDVGCSGAGPDGEATGATDEAFTTSTLLTC